MTPETDAFKIACDRQDAEFAQRLAKAQEEVLADWAIIEAGMRARAAGSLVALVGCAAALVVLVYSWVIGS